MIDVRNIFKGGLNLDDAPIQVDKQQYIDANNITRDAIAGSADSIITNVVGNRIVSYADYPAGTSKIIGMYANTIRNTLIFFRWNVNDYHGVYEFNKTTRVVTKIFENITDSGGEDILGFTENDKITSINIINRDEGDLLFFLDSLGRPTKMDITLFKAGAYTPVTRDIIDVALLWPYVPITGVYGNDSTKSANRLLNKLFKFQYIWVNDDLTETCGSPESATALPSNILNPVFTQTVTNNNVIHLSIPTGSLNVKGIKLLMSWSEKQNVWNDYVLVEYLDKSKLSISDDSVYSYDFYNDSTYSLFDVDRRIQLFDYVPIYATAQEMPNGNALAYGGITEGYNNDLTSNVTLTVDTVAVGNGSVVGTLSETHTVLNLTLTSRRLQEIFSGTPAVGTVITIKANSDSVTFATYTTVAGDTTQQVVNGLYTSAISLGFASPLIVSSTTINFIYNDPPYTYSSTSIVASTTNTDYNSIATWPFLSQRRLGLVYFDQKGRTNGVVYNSQVIFPAYAENISHQVLVPYIDAKIYHAPPDWAYSFSWVVTHDNTDYLYFCSVDVNTLESDYIYFDITNLPVNQKKNPTTAAVISWSFQDGDRFRLIRRQSDGTVYSSTYDAAVEGILVEPTINNTVQTGKTFIKIRKTTPFITVDFTSKYFVFELYRPNQPQASGQNLPFFEFGETYSIINPTESTRIHSGSITNQTTNYITPAEFKFYGGDSYVRPRTVYTVDSPSSGFSTFYVQDRNFVDNYISAVNSLDGRANAIDPNARQAFYPAMLRFSLEYEPNTNVNKTNRFLAENFDEYEYSYGTIKRLKVRDRFMRVFQQLKTGVVPIFSKIGKNANGDEITIVTDQLLNPIQYYNGDYGIGDAAESLASFNFADYFCDTKRGAIIRVSLDGVTTISVLYKVNSWAVEHIPLRTGNYKIYGAFDQRLNNYILALEESNYNLTPTCRRYRLTNNNLTSKGYTYTDCNGGSQSGILAADQSVTFCALLGSVVGVDLQIENLTSCSPDLTDSPYTLSFDEESNTFESFYSFHPEMMATIGTLLISAKDGEIYTHDNSLYNTFYNETYDSDITFVFNDKALFKKTWVGVSQVASGTWDCPSIITNSYSYGTTPQNSNLVAAEFTLFEGMPSATFRRDINSNGGKINGGFLKGNYATIKFRKQNPTTIEMLSMISVNYINSSLTVI